MKADFTDDEKRILNGKARAVARKFNVSNTYVSNIIKGSANISSELAQNIFNDLKELITFFQPLSESKTV